MSERPTAQGVVDEVLARALYRVRLTNGQEITASLTPRARQVTVELLRGDHVVVELSPYDPTRGRITQTM